MGRAGDSRVGGQGPVGILLAQPHVQTGGLDLAGVQSVQQGGLVHVGTPGDVDDHHAILHLRKGLRIHQG
ncbi:DNA binding domain, excisionase family, partial [Dysosmobacter welbionis]